MKFVNWIGTLWKGKITFETPMLFALGFLVTFLFGGLTGVLLASPPLDFHVSDSYFVVAHFHYVLFGTIVFATFAGIYFWFPKMTGRMMDETLGKVHFWTLFIGFHTTFLVQHWLGNEGMPRRYVDYLPTDGFTTLNAISSIGAFILGLSTLPFLWNVFKSYRFGRVVTVDDPWGFGNSLEWATSCPPPRHNFTELPRIRSERPAFELHYPEYVERFRARRTSAGTRRRTRSRRRALAGRTCRTTTPGRADSPMKVVGRRLPDRKQPQPPSSSPCGGAHREPGALVDHCRLRRDHLVGVVGLAGTPGSTPTARGGQARRESPSGVRRHFRSAGGGARPGSTPDGIAGGNRESGARAAMEAPRAPCHSTRSLRSCRLAGARDAGRKSKAGRVCRAGHWFDAKTRVWPV